MEGQVVEVGSMEGQVVEMGLTTTSLQSADKFHIIGLYSLAGKLVGELCSPLFQDYVGKPWGLGKEKEFEKLEKTLSTLKAVLLDAEDRQETNHQIRDWLTKIKLVFYDVEDLLLEVTTEALKRQVMTRNKRAKEVRIFFSSSNQLKYRFNMGGKVKLIRESLDAIASDRNNFNLAERHEKMNVMSTGCKRRDETHSFVPVDKFIGREKDKRDVTSLLLESDCAINVSVISIIGFGGLGKTTLAQSVYNSDEVKGHFDLIMWVCVSDVFDIKLICENIIESATKNKYERLQMDLVKDKVKNVTDGRKYLLVLDDVWNEDPIEWMNLEVLLSGGGKGSKILITARSKLVARAAKSKAVHFLKGLPHKESWELFKQVAFKHGVEPESSKIVRIGMEVVDICDGVPLAIKTIGSMLGLKEEEADWLDFKKNDLPMVTRDKDGKVVPILKLSYDNLSAPLKRCFAHCAVFPKDHRIGKEQLVRMWMAQGLIQSDGTKRSLEEVGEQLFMDLLNRSLFNVWGFNHTYFVPIYKMHDLIHDLALSVGGNEYYNLGSDINCINQQTRHAWVPLHVTTNLLHAKQLRTLVVRDAAHDMGSPKVKEIMSVFKKIRHLHLAELNITRVPPLIDGLGYLSYLDLSRNTFDRLPESICRLYNLQTLILFCCENLEELPTGTKNLVSLRHLDIAVCDKLSHMPSGLDELTCLQTLSVFAIGREGNTCCELGELKSLVNLREKLAIKGLRRSKLVKFTSTEGCYPELLSQLTSLQHLELDWSDGNEAVTEEEEQLLMFEILRPCSGLERLSIIGFEGRMFPSWMDRAKVGVSLPNIVYIFLEDCKSWDHIPPLGLLPSLQELCLSRMDGIEYFFDSSSASNAPDQVLFPSLKELDLWGMSNLKRFVGPTKTSCLNNRHFPVLEKLNVSSCPLFVADGSDVDPKQFVNLPSLRDVEICSQGIETLPAWLQFIPNLQRLDLRSCREIETLPEWMGNLASLQKILLINCESLVTIPDCVERLTSLQQMTVVGCPKLTGRCKKDTGADWHKIAHIPNITVKETWRDYISS